MLTTFLEFRLPSGAGGMAAGYTKQGITKQLKQLTEQYNIRVKRTVQKAYRYRVEFERDQDYTLFALVWVPKGSFWRPELRHDDIDADPVYK